MYKIVFYMFFGPVVAEEGGKQLTWDTEKSAETWARANCGPNAFEIFKAST